ncbi:MAG: NADH-quinone oxidoreductase subunit N [Phycisphaerales bacterium]
MLADLSAVAPGLLASGSLAPKFSLIAPEMVLFCGAVLAAILGLSRSRSVRVATPWLALATLGATLITTLWIWTPEAAAAAQLPMPMLGKYVIAMLCVVGAGHVMSSMGQIDRAYERQIAVGSASFDPVRIIQGEYYAFLLLSLCGAMLLCHATDLVWLFLAFELCSLPTYVLVAIGRTADRSMEAAIKYFFLGAMSTATMLLGFAFLYGATGTLELEPMREAFQAQAQTTGIGSVAIVGILLAVIGICFKLAAVPMHFYAPDVYEGAATPVAAFISFVPKVQGFVTLILLLGTVGWNSSGEPSLPPVIAAVLWMIAVLTMTLGNIGGLLQGSTKRMLAYSSIANSGYMLVGVLGAPLIGIDAMLLYLLTYGVANLATFGALAAVERNGAEVDSIDDLAGLRVRAPLAAVALAIGALSLTGIPPLLGFWGKLGILMTTVQAHQKPLLVIVALNSAIAAFYYLRLVAWPWVQEPTPRTQGVTHTPGLWPRLSAIVFAVGCIVVPVAVGPCKDLAVQAARFQFQNAPAPAAAQAPASSNPANPAASEPSNAPAQTLSLSLRHR